ncbi:MAG: DNA-protecting protein DprA, partial [Dokdonella sp.]|nr:DNA-protecting protein DprA [Dokdonella sp.]
GCHQLIRQGAKLVETAAEIVEELAPLAERLGASLRQRLSESPAPAGAGHVQPVGCTRETDPEYARLFAALGTETLGIDQLAERSGLEVATLSSMLLMLELEGVIVVRHGGYARRIGAPS